MAYRIGTLVVDPEAHEVRRDGVLVPVEPQVFDLLVLLIANRQRSLTKDEIVERIWRGRAVSDATLSSRVRSARQVLGDDGSAQKLIRTIHSRGFRFVGEVEEVGPTGALSISPNESALPDASRTARLDGSTGWSADGERAQTSARASPTPRSVPFMAPDPPRGFVERHEQTALLKAHLLESRASLVALKGAGGFGKTAIANRLCRDPDVRAAYCDGILHVELGESPDNLATRVADLVEVLTGERSGLQTVGALSAALASALGERRCLLVVDDAWREQDLLPFLQGGLNTTRLVTTRLDHILPADARRVAIDAMQAEEAVALLGQGLPAEQLGPQRPALLALAARLGEWPLQLALVNGFLRDRVTAGRRPLAQAIADVERRLEARGLTAFDAKNDAARHRAVDKTLGVSLDLLAQDERARFRELAVFPEDVDVPVGSCARLWRETDGLDEIDSEDLLQRLFGYSLLLGLDLEAGTFRLHDVVRHYLLEGWKRESGMVRLHESLIAAMDDLKPGSFEGDGERRYACAHGPRHLVAAGQEHKLRALLLDPRWMQDKLQLTGLQSLISDYHAYGAGRAHELIGSVLDLSGRILAVAPGQLAAQLLARLAPHDAEGMDAVLVAASSCLPYPALVPLRPTFTTPGAEVRRFEGHCGIVSSLAVLDRRRFVSCSHDRTLRLWDVETASELRRFEGHSEAVLAIVAPDPHRVLSASADKTIRLWDVETGREIRRFVGHEGEVNCLALLGDRVLSGSADWTLRLWDIDTGQELRRIALANTAPPEDAASEQGSKSEEAWRRIWGHEDGVGRLAIINGWALCGLVDRSLRLIELETGKELRRFGDSASRVYPVRGLAVLGEDRFLEGGSERGMVRVWQAATGREVENLEGMRFWAAAIDALDDKRVVVGIAGYCELEVWDVDAAQRLARVGSHQSAIASVAALDRQHALCGVTDGSIRLWDLETRDELVRFKGLEHWVASFAVLDERRVLTAAWHGALLMWDMTTGDRILDLKGGHDHWVQDIAVFDSRRALSGGRNDNLIRLWDLETGEELRRFEGHRDGLAQLAAVDDLRFLSGSHDKTLRLWHVENGQELRRFEGHEEAVLGLAIVDDHRMVSVSVDRTLRLWEIDTGREICRFDGHNDSVHAIAMVDGRRAISGSADRTARLWDVDTGRELQRLVGHEGAVLCFAVMDGRHAISGSEDKTLRLWDLETGAQLVRFDGDAAFTSLALMPDKRTLVARDGLARLHWFETRLAPT
jgi:WD40 repeat protein/DNA-binding winged helix-turn-helix (wHTH) protein